MRLRDGSDAPVLERHLVRTELGYVHVRTTGRPGDGPELCFLHQVPASGRLWLPVMSELSPLPCIAPDNLNLGESDATSRTLSLEEHADVLWEAVQSLRPGPKILIGHHTGAAVAAVMADRFASQVAGLALIGYPYYTDWKQKLAKFERLNPVPTDPDGDGVAGVWRFIRRAFAEQADPELVFEAFADRIRAGRVWYEGYLALWTSDLDGIARAARDDARPTMVIAPERDPLSVVADEVGEILGTAPRRTTGGAFVITEDPALVADLVRDLYDDAIAR